MRAKAVGGPRRAADPDGRGGRSRDPRASRNGAARPRRTIRDLLVVLAPLALSVVFFAALRLAEGASERRRRDAFLAQCGPAEDPEALALPGVHTLEGVLRGPAPLARIGSFHPFGSSFLGEPNAYARTSASADAFEVELARGFRVRLEGPRQVVVGDTETDHRASNEMAEKLGLPRDERAHRPGQFRLVTTGKRVRVRGYVTRGPDDDSGYRATSRVLHLAPPPFSGEGVRVPILLASVERPHVARIGAWTFARSPVAVMGLGVVLSALAFVYYLSSLKLAPPPGALTAPVAVEAKEPACSRQVRELLAKNRFADAQATACDVPDTVATLAFVRGAFDEASAAWSDPSGAPSLSRAEAHLFARAPRRTELAAATTQQMVRVFYPGPATDERRYLECVAGLVERRADADRVREPAWPRAANRRTCGHKLTPRIALELEDEGGMAGGFEPDAPFYEAVRAPAGAVVGARGRLFARPVGLENRLLSEYVFGTVARPTPRPIEAQRGRYGLLGAIWDDGARDRYVRLSAFAAELALFYAWAGLPERAKPLFEMLDRVAADRAGHADLLAHVMSIATAAAHFANDEPRMKRYGALADTHSAGAHLQVRRMLDPKNRWESPPIEDGHWVDHVEQFDVAARGDGAALAEVLKRQGATGAETLPRIVPRITKNREALVAWFESDFPAPCTTCGAFALLGHLVDRRTVATLLGQPDDSQSAITALVDALTSPEFAYEVDELETFFAPKR